MRRVPAPRRFRIRIAAKALKDLERRLNDTRWPDAIAGSGWQYGADLRYMRRLVDYWRRRFDWRQAERRLNSFPHFRVNVDGVGIHFIHARGKGPTPLPLIVTHGWPGSFVEMLDLIPRLADPAAHGGDPADAFDVVVPSLPGYGFSDRPATPGTHNRRIADLWQQLMTRLGYERFGAQGGDWGAGISTWLARRHPHRLAGIHLNYIPGSLLPDLGPGTPPLTRAEIQFRADKERWLDASGAYGHIQGTTPQTVGYGLNDSPAGLAAWIVEKFYHWSDCDGDLDRRIAVDDLLTNITLYWVTGTINSSMRIYYESNATRLELGPGERITVPCGVAVFPKEAPAPPREWVERAYNLTRWTPMPHGGHFAALEEPELLAADIQAFFRPLRARS